tara:strand:+ start:535 stop:1959 length:1425 start_codon:yes stop_codon:yes gene_type:complete
MSVIVSLNKRDLFGYNDGLAFESRDDMNHFSRITKVIGNVVMGSNTWRSLPEKNKPLRDRMNIIITSNEEIIRKTCNDLNVICYDSIDKVFENVDEPCFIGGKKLIEEVFRHHGEKIKKIYLSRIIENSYIPVPFGIYLNIPLSNYKIQTTFTSLSNVKSNFTKKEDIFSIQHITYKQDFEHNEFVDHNNYEKYYLNTMKNILKSPYRLGRNGYVYSKFGFHFKYDCSNGKVPLLTTKNMAWKTCIKELLWFLRGETDNKILQEQKVHIWDGNSTREFLDNRGLNNYREGELGPVYGFQWRHYGAKYVNCDTNYTGQGTDQLEICAEMLRKEPYSRRIIMTAWNVSDLDKMALPPCHILIQWYVDSNFKLWLQFYQRSADMFLGVPFNMFSYSVLLHMMSARTGIETGGVMHCIGDAHIYANHKEAIEKQFQNPILNQPILKINKKSTWEEYDITDFTILDYKPAPHITAPMSA